MCPIFESYEVALENIDVNVDKVPMALCLVSMMQKQKSAKPLVVLFDSGSSHTWLNQKALPKGCVPTKVDAVSSRTLAGTLNSNLSVEMERLVFPEFFKTRFIDSVEARVFQTPC